MNWLVRFLCWTLALAWPTYLLARPYQNLLLWMLSAPFGVHIPTPSNTPPDLAAANVLGVYVALCLATVAAPRKTRGRAIVLGLIVLTLVEWSSGVIGLFAAAMHHSAPTAATSQSSASETLERAPQWVAAPALWMAFLGAWVLPKRARSLVGVRHLRTRERPALHK